MAVNIPNLNINAIGDGLQDRKNYEAILDILQRYRKELNFYLMNLDLDNMPAVAENIDWIHQDIDGVKITVGNNAGDIAALVVEADQISATVANNIGDIATLTQTANSIQTLVSNNAGDISSLVQTAQGIQTQVTNNTGNISTVTQTAQGIQTQVSSHNTLLGTHSSQITQLDNSISSKVSYTDYNGAEIVSLIEQTASSIKLSANKIDLTGITTLYDANSSGFKIVSRGRGLAFYDGSVEYLNITYRDPINARIYANAGLYLGKSGTSTYFEGRVDFNGATVDGLTMKFA